MLQEGLGVMAQKLPPMEMESNGKRIVLRLEGVTINRPAGPPRNNGNTAVLPAECRRMGRTYAGNLQLSWSLRINGIACPKFTTDAGKIPVMVRSEACTLNGMNSKQLVAAYEEENELGGYFILNGNDRMIRMLIMTRRNFMLASSRSSYKKKGEGFTEHAVIVRSVARDETSRNVFLHWRVACGPVVSLPVGSSPYAVKLGILLRALTDKSTLGIYDDMIRGEEHVASLKTIAVEILQQIDAPELESQERALIYLGVHFRKTLSAAPWKSDLEVGKEFIERCLFVHLSNTTDKYHLLCAMLRKLHALVSGRCIVDANDNIMFQEVLLPGSLYLQVLKEAINLYLKTLRMVLEKVPKSRKSGPKDVDHELIQRMMIPRLRDISHAVEYFLTTGNLPQRVSNLGLMQSSGLCVGVDFVNMLRFAAHFRAVHRGAFFAEMRTTEVRKLQPESFGFICPVHSPDGAPCGLLNHISANCTPTHRPIDENTRENLISMLVQRGWLVPVQNVSMLATVSGATDADTEANAPLPVFMDGQLLGWVSEKRALLLQDWLHLAKVSNNTPEELLVPTTLEVAVCSRHGPTAVSYYPAMYLFTGGSRLMRPVRSLRTLTNTLSYRSAKYLQKHLHEQPIEWIGTFEQAYSQIAIRVTETDTYIPTMTQLVELSPSDSLFSFAASLSPYPDYNQSPRNLYQCQMGKQTMGFSSYTINHRSDNKHYRLVTPQKPLVYTRNYEKYGMNDYPLGTNAVVSVLSYTGYDMEDAMVLNRASVDRGCFDAIIFKSYVVNLSKEKRNACELGFPDGRSTHDKLDNDGLPFVGERLLTKNPLYAYYDLETCKTTIERYSGAEEAFVESVSISSWTEATITLRIRRRPDIGDKFASRHGQKGVNSLQVPELRMPFCMRTGMAPDLLFNPHGYPSRMTVGMMLETVAAKAAALTGVNIDCTPFQRTESDKPLYENYCELLQQNRFDYWGKQTLVSGETGRVLESPVFQGIVYYQRLRHMVADKYQMRTIGGVESVTRQPIKGRKRGGGIRLGEMERDCILAHGMCGVLFERMVESNSDSVIVRVCTQCGSLTDCNLVAMEKQEKSVWEEVQPGATEEQPRETSIYDQMTSKAQNWRCRYCGPSSNWRLIRQVQVPFVFLSLVNQLAVFGVRLSVDTKKYSFAQPQYLM